MFPELLFKFFCDLTLNFEVSPFDVMGVVGVVILPQLFYRKIILSSCGINIALCLCVSVRLDVRLILKASTPFHNMKHKEALP